MPTFAPPLPASAGDTAYAGVVLHDGFVYVSYYTSSVRHDYPWAIGMLARSDVRIAKLPCASLLQLAAARAE
jgi:hypothetical protein